MIQSRTSVAPLALFFAFVLAAVYGGLALFQMSVAHADVVADPVVAATAATDASWSLVAQYGPIWGVALLAFGTIGAFLRTNEAQHWLAQGRKLALIVGASSILAAVLDWHFHGAPIAGVLVTAIMAIKLVWSPAVAVAKTGPVIDATRTTSGTIGVLAIAVLLSGSQVSCGPITNVTNAVIDCARLDVGKIESLAGQLAQSLAAYVLAGRPVDWAALESQAESVGSDIGACALGPVVNAFLAPPPGRAAPSPEQGQAARAAFERARLKAGGGPVKTLHAGVL